MGAQFAALSLGSVTPASIQSVTATGEGTERMAISGDIGPFFAGAFTVSIAASFESYSVAGDGIAAFLTILPEYERGQLALTGFVLEADLFDDGDHVSSLEMHGDFGNSRSGPGFDVVGIASPFNKEGVSGYIGNHGTILLTMNFLWVGAGDFDTLRLTVADGSEIDYMANLFPTPGPGAVLGVGAMMAAGRRRR